MNERKRGILLSYLNIFLHAAIGFLYVPILLHFIGKSEYGLYQLMGSLIAYFGVMDFGLSTAVVRFYAKARAEKDAIGAENILAIALRGYGIITIFVLALGALGYAELPAIFACSMTGAEIAEAQAIFLLLLLNVVVTLLSTAFRSAINARERFFFLKGTETVQLVLQPVLVVLLLMASPSAFSVALVQTVLNVALSLWRIGYCFRRLHVTVRYHGMDRALYVAFRRLAVSVFAISIIDQIFWKTNQVILGVISGTEAVAVYSIASLVYMNYMALSTAISGVYLPHVTALFTRHAPVSEISALFIRIGRAQYFLLLLVMSGFVLFGREFIRLWAGQGFEEAYGITILIAVPFTIDLIQNIGNSILQAMNRYDFRAKVLSGVGLLNLVLAIPLGMEYGGIGCAAATGLSMFLGNGVIMNWFYAKELHLAIGKFWREIAKISLLALPCVALGLLLNHFCPQAGLVGFCGKVAIYTVVYSGIMVVFGVTEDEKRRIFRR